MGIFPESWGEEGGKAYPRAEARVLAGCDAKAKALAYLEETTA